MASSLSLVQLSSVEPVLGLPTHWNRDRLLNALCNSLEACLTYPMSHDLMLTLLLSAVSAGVPVTPPTQTSGTTARNQVCRPVDLVAAETSSSCVGSCTVCHCCSYTFNNVLLAEPTECVTAQHEAA